MRQGGWGGGGGGILQGQWRLFSRPKHTCSRGGGKSGNGIGAVRAYRGMARGTAKKKKGGARATPIKAVGETAEKKKVQRKLRFSSPAHHGMKRKRGGCARGGGREP